MDRKDRPKGREKKIGTGEAEVRKRGEGLGGGTSADRSENRAAILTGLETGMRRMLPEGPCGEPDQTGQGAEFQSAAAV